MTLVPLCGARTLPTQEQHQRRCGLPARYRVGAEGRLRCTKHARMAARRGEPLVPVDPADALEAP